MTRFRPAITFSNVPAASGIKKDATIVAGIRAASDEMNDVNVT
jgi:hypothetical protein